MFTDLNFDTICLMRSSIHIYSKVAKMGDTKENEAYEEELLDYEEDDEKAPDSVNGKVNGESAKK